MAEQKAAMPMGDGSIDRKKFLALVKSVDAAKQRKDDAQSELGNCYHRGEETIGINRKPFKLSLQIRDMEEEKRAIFWRDLLLYLSLLGVDPTAQRDMFEEDPAGADGKVVRHPRNGATDQPQPTA